MPNTEATLDNRHSLALPYWARPGVALFAKKADDEGDVEDEDGDEDDEDEDDEEDEDEDKSPEELAAELKKVRDALKKANGSSAKKRSTTKQLRARIAELEGAAGAKPKRKKDDEGDEEEVDLDAVRAAAKAEAKAEADATRIADKSELVLARAGVDPKRLAKAVKLLDFDDVELNDDGTLDGLDEQIDTLREEWPELFAKPRKRRSTAGQGDRDGQERERNTTKSTTERQLAGVMRRK